VTSTHLPAAFIATFVVLADVDGDDDPDAVTDRGLYLDNGGGVFQPVTATHLLPRSATGTCAALSDVDLDGDVDLVFGESGQDIL